MFAIVNAEFCQYVPKLGKGEYIEAFFLHSKYLIACFPPVSFRKSSGNICCGSSSAASLISASNWEISPWSQANHLKFWTSRDHSDDIRYKIHPQISKCEMSAQPSLPKFAKFMLTFCSAKCWPSQIFTPCCDFASSHNRVGSRFRPSVFYIR